MANKNHSNIEIRQVVEYSHFFVGENPIDVDAVLRQYDRNTLMRMAIILSCHYGNLFIPDSRRTLFSDVSDKHISKLNKLFKRFYERSNIPEGSPIIISTFRTALELWRRIFAIKPEDYKGTIKIEDTELTLFKILLSLNEKLVAFVHNDQDYKLDELLYLNQFLTNDTNNFDFKRALQPQLYYVYHLIQLCEKNDLMRKASEVLFERWGITSWQQYVGTLMYLANQTAEYRKGAEVALSLCRRFGISIALMKAKSPSCGAGRIYDGTFSGTLTDGDGVTVSLLSGNGIKIFTENDINSLL